MRSSFIKTMGGTLLAISLLGAFAVPKASSQQDGGGRIEGTWNVQLSVRNCATGAVIRTFPEVTTFMFGGTMIDSTSGRKQAAKTPGQGVWSHDTGNTYQFKFKHFNFDDAGVFVGWTIVTQVATLNSDATEYTSAGTAENYDANGAFISGGCSTTTATRFE